MKLENICMICSELETGRNGVGDYSRRLGEALEALGHKVTLVSVNDRFVDQPVGLSRSGIGSVVRIPVSLPVEERFMLARRAMDHHDPDWISLQFVCWGFGKHGVVSEQLRHLQQITRGRNLHLMFHEPWFESWSGDGLNTLRRFKLGALGQAQKISISLLNRAVRPKISHTSNSYYQRVFKSVRIETKLLPLFGNIPVSGVRDWSVLRGLMISRGELRVEEGRDRILLIGLFGGLNILCPVFDAFRRIAHLAIATGRRPVILSFGHVGPDGDRIIAEWKGAFPDIEFGQIGPLDDHMVSICINGLDAAITTHPWQVIGRSGSVAALLEHGIPVITCWGFAPPPGDLFSARWAQLIWQADESLATRLTSPPARLHYGAAVEDAAELMIADLRSIA
ncbi:MAG: hypothetical protein JWM91_2717 [Rhodospirillales bacterium]|nr:hypothetical protein [Rhodospirillales bacterium]